MAASTARDGGSSQRLSRAAPLQSAAVGPITPRMLRAYGPDCDGKHHRSGHGAIPPGATWIDLEEPTREEEKLVERMHRPRRADAARK